jgi:hypothetical protein
MAFVGDHFGRQFVVYDPAVFASKASDAQNDLFSSVPDQCTVAAAHYGFLSLWQQGQKNGSKLLTKNTCDRVFNQLIF